MITHIPCIGPLLVICNILSSFLVCFVVTVVYRASWVSGNSLCVRSRAATCQWSTEQCCASVWSVWANAYWWCNVAVRGVISDVVCTYAWVSTLPTAALFSMLSESECFVLVFILCCHIVLSILLSILSVFLEALDHLVLFVPFYHLIVRFELAWYSCYLFA